MKENEIYIVKNGELKNIVDLDRKDYESFLESMRMLIAMYATLTTRPLIEPNPRT